MDEDTINLTNERLKCLPPRLVASRLPVQVLVLRQNSIGNDGLEGLEAFAPTLRSLDLNLNSLTCVPAPVLACRFLTYLDLSFNSIVDMAPLAALEHLEELYLAKNAIEVPALRMGSAIKTLELGANAIRDMSPIAVAASLESLWMGRNRVRAIVGLDRTPNLTHLDLQSNRLRGISGLEALGRLQELYLAHNRITRIEGIAGAPQLRVLDLGNNRIAEIETPGGMAALEDLWLNDNLIQDLETVERLRSLPCLTTLYLEGNPAATPANYRLQVILILPGLKQLDATPVITPAYLETEATAPNRPAAAAATHEGGST